MKSVYLIRGNDGKYKIGIAKNPKQRILQLQTGNSDQLTLIEAYKSENANQIESTLHRRFSYVRNVGEWFDLSVTEEVNFIKICKNIDESINYLKNMGNCFI
jgi:hypothetical protein